MKIDIIKVVDVLKIFNVVVYLSMIDKFNKEKMFFCNFLNVVEFDWKYIVFMYLYKILLLEFN